MKGNRKDKKKKNMLQGRRDEQEMEGKREKEGNGR